MYAEWIGGEGLLLPANIQRTQMIAGLFGFVIRLIRLMLKYTADIDEQLNSN